MTNAQLCQYVRNTGQAPLRVDDFDDDWCPVGEQYREQLVDAGLIEVRASVEPTPDDPDAPAPEPGGIYLTDAGRALTAEPGTPEAISISQGRN
jgi:hypothetical protein